MPWTTWGTAGKMHLTEQFSMKNGTTRRCKHGNDAIADIWYSYLHYSYIYIYYYSYIIYLLVICQNSYWTWNLYSWFTYSRLWFSIAMLVYQTVIDMFLSWQMGQMDIDVLFRCFHVIFCMIIIPIKRNILKLYMDLTKENIENKNVPYRFPK